LKKQQQIIKYGFIIIVSFCLISGFEFNIQGQEQLQAEPTCGDGNTEKWAVIIAASGGVSYARNELMDRNDVRKLTKVLLNNGWNEDHLFILLEEQATTEAIMNDSFSWLRSQGEDEDDLVFYFFSGHGYYHTCDEPPLDEPDGRDELIHPWDPDMAGWNPNVFILDDDLKDKFDLLHSKNLVIIFNTCHAGGMIDGAHDVAESGRVVLTSCDVDEASYGMKIPYDWIFPYYCVKGLQNHADRDNDKCVSAEEMFEYTVEPVQHIF